MKVNVLVFPCGSEIGLEIHKSLCFSTHINLIGGSSVEDHGQFVYANYIEDIPSVSDDDFVTRLNQLVQQHKIDYIFPAHDSVVLKLAQARAHSRLQCEVITSPVVTCEIARSKKATYEALDGVINIPKMYAAIDQLTDSDLPVFLKPDVGQGSKGTHLAATKEEIEFLTKKDPSLLLLEYLPGKEYTVDCFTDKDGTLRFCEGRERSRISGGISVNAQTVNDSRFEELAENINKTLSFRGVWFFQVKESKTGDLVLMEIAPRVAGTMGLVRCKGVNLALLSVFDAMGMVVGIFENQYEMVIDRALQNSYKHNVKYEHVYLDFDDLVILEEKVNPSVMAFVYQCFNKGIKVHLLTKHKDDLHATLKIYRLDNLFDEIIWIKEGEHKYPHIKEHNAIFIDDSFMERKSVHDKLGIPVFDAHMIESLMEKN